MRVVGVTSHHTFHAVRLYLGSMRIDADPFTGFTKNLTTLRCEVKTLFHVRNAKGARRIAAA